jgi:hypothetical protein
MASCWFGAKRLVGLVGTVPMNLKAMLGRQVKGLLPRQGLVHARGCGNVQAVAVTLQPGIDRTRHK